MALQKATITNVLSGERIPVQFNPEQVSLSRANNFAEVAVHGLSSPLLQFSNGALRRLTMELLVDTLEGHVEGSRVLNRAGEDVRNLTEKIVALLDIDAATHAPPPVVFNWTSIEFKAVVTQADQTFVMFNGQTPVRARLQMSFSELTSTELESKTVKRETADFTKSIAVPPAGSLAQLAQQEYGRAAYWVLIAAANGIEDPRHIVSGTPLVVPSLPYTDPQTGRVFR